MTKMTAPLIVTLKLDDTIQSFFNALREAHFPKHVNYMDAHCTLFHNLPSQNDAIQKILKEVTLRPEMNMQVKSVSNIGNGVVYTIESSELQALHRSMQQHFSQWLINQDRQILKPHITVQNKVTAFKALSLFNELNAAFKPFDIKATGISTWLYLKGPWQHVEDYNFV
ncbi:MAG: 2'-5' RNA ligase family protein [Ferruginibacter sp.]